VKFLQYCTVLPYNLRDTWVKLVFPVWDVYSPNCLIPAENISHF
jgi:hypothetical protein